MTEEITEFITKIFPFKGIEENLLNSIFSEIDFSVCTFQKGEAVFSKEYYRKTVGFVISGECTVERERSGCEAIPLNSLPMYASFGILSVFSPESEYPTLIRAVKPSKILFLSGEDMLRVTKKYPAVSMNVIDFLVGRISFLNKKIETFSGKSTSEKLASYLMEKFKNSGSEITVSRTKISAEIGVGRASLYRDLDCLEKRGIIKTDQKKIIIICPEGLERILK